MANWFFLKPFGIDLFCLGKKFLVFNLVSRNLKIKYRRSILGILWTLFSPLAQAAVLYFVFKVVMQVQVPHYLAFILSGMLPWAFFSQTLGEGTEAIVGSISLITKVPVPIQVFPYVGAMTNLVTLFLAAPIMVGASLVSGVTLGPSVLMTFPYFALLFLMAYGFSLILSVGFVYLRDLKHLIGIILQIWFYGTPVVYQSSMIPAKYHWILYANPLGTAFAGFQRIFGQGLWPSRLETGVFALWTFGILLCAARLYRHFSTQVAENL